MGFPKIHGLCSARHQHFDGHHSGVGRCLREGGECLSLQYHRNIIEAEDAVMMRKTGDTKDDVANQIKVSENVVISHIKAVECGSCCEQQAQCLGILL